MSLSLEQIVEEVRNWPPEQVGELLTRLNDDLQATDSEVETAWKAEIKRRIEEMDNGAVQWIPGDEVLARMRAKLKRT